MVVRRGWWSAAHLPELEAISETWVRHGRARLRGAYNAQDAKALSFGGTVVNRRATMPAHARCLSCGYLLRGLPEPVCPECARAFDPEDASTFDADPRTHRRRRWLIRGATVLTVVVLVVAFGPRGFLKADVKFTCSRCNRLVTVTRWQLNPPSWISFAYPGIDSRSDSTARAPGPARQPCDHRYKYAIRSDLPIGGRVTGWGSVETRRPTTINGVPLSIDTASQVLRALLKPGNNGIGP